MLETITSFDYLTDLGWAAELFAVVTITLLARYIAMRFLKVVGRHFEKTSNAWDDALFDAARLPASYFILIMGLLWAVEISDGHIGTELFSAANLDIFRQLTFIVLIALFLIRFINRAEERLLQNQQDEADELGTTLDPTTLQALGKLLRLAILIFAVLIGMPIMGIEVTALLAFGGVGGIAIGFAAKDLLANFFGGLMIYLDRPFALGDWIRSPDREIEGTVEKIGWRLTVVRTFDKRPLYVPNSVFNTLSLENPSRMTNRRIKETIGIRYKDSEKMGAIVKDVKAMLQSHDEIDASQTLIVNFLSYGASSLDFFIYTFTKTTNWVDFHEIKQDVMLKIVEIVHSHGADFAFPTRTLDGLDGLILSNTLEAEP